MYNSIVLPMENFMFSTTPLNPRNSFVRKSFSFLLPFLLLLAIVPSVHAQVSVDYELIARSGETAIPGGVGTFTGFGGTPAIDDAGNIVFYGMGSSQRGIYTVIGQCCQVVADFNTLVPNGGGETFNNFSGAESNRFDYTPIHGRRSGSEIHSGKGAFE